MTSRLEQLPPEILEQIITLVPRSARGVSRTLRVATEREFQQLCHRPISQSELELYLDQAPQQIALLHRRHVIERVIESEAHAQSQVPISYRFEVYHWVNYPLGHPGNQLAYYQPYFIALELDRRNNVVRVTDAAPPMNEEEPPPLVTVERIMTEAGNHNHYIYMELDLLSQWRILRERFGCRMPESTTDDPELATKEFARDYLHRQFTDRFNYLIGRIQELIISRQRVTNFIAVGLLQYLKIYSLH